MKHTATLPVIKLTITSTINFLVSTYYFDFFRLSKYQYEYNISGKCKIVKKCFDQTVSLPNNILNNIKLNKKKIVCAVL